MNVNAKPIGSEAIHFWLAFLFDDFNENI